MLRCLADETAPLQLNSKTDLMGWHMADGRDQASEAVQNRRMPKSTGSARSAGLKQTSIRTLRPKKLEAAPLQGVFRGVSIHLVDVFHVRPQFVQGDSQ